MRVFVAITLPREIKAELSTLCDGIPGAKWTREAQFHLTLRFIGEVNAGQQAAIHAALSTIRSAPFMMTLKGVGQFPPRGKPRILWVGVSAPDTLPQLAEQVKTVLSGMDVPLDSRPFSPHITLARFNTPPKAESMNPYYRQHRFFQTEPMYIGRFVLMSSILGKGGAHYQVQSSYRMDELEDGE